MLDNVSSVGALNIAQMSFRVETIFVDKMGTLFAIFGSGSSGLISQLNPAPALSSVAMQPRKFTCLGL